MNKLIGILGIVLLLGLVSAEKIDAKVDNVYYPHMEDMEKLCGSSNVEFEQADSSINKYIVECIDKKHDMLLAHYYETYWVTVTEYGEITNSKDITEEAMGEAVGDNIDVAVVTLAVAIAFQMVSLISRTHACQSEC